MQQQRQNIRSTQSTTNAINSIVTQTEQETPMVQENTTNYVYIKPIPITGNIHTDQTGGFPIQSSAGNKYIMILYHYDCNAILTAPMKSRNGDELVKAYTQLHQYLEERGHQPQLQRLDNEAPDGLQRFMTIRE